MTDLINIQLQLSFIASVDRRIKCIIQCVNDLYKICHIAQINIVEIIQLKDREDHEICSATRRNKPCGKMIEP